MRSILSVCAVLAFASVASRGEQVSIAEILASPDRYYGRRVTICCRVLDDKFETRMLIDPKDPNAALCFVFQKGPGGDRARETLKMLISDRDSSDACLEGVFVREEREPSVVYLSGPDVFVVDKVASSNPISAKNKKTAEPGATDNPEDAQHLREDY